MKKRRRTRSAAHVPGIDHSTSHQAGSQYNRDLCLLHADDLGVNRSSVRVCKSFHEGDRVGYKERVFVSFLQPFTLIEIKGKHHNKRLRHFSEQSCMGTVKESVRTYLGGAGSPASTYMMMMKCTRKHARRPAPGDQQVHTVLAY